MTWPAPHDYNEAIQNPQINFWDADLRGGCVEVDQLGLPRPYSGAFASVYRLKSGSCDFAVRCFLHNFADQRQRYDEISQFLRRQKVPYMVDFEYQSDGIAIQGKRFPILKMEWVEGDLLSTFVDANVRNSALMLELSRAFKSMVVDLGQSGIAHGDLQHGNILVVGNQLKLVDYDGLFVPQLAGYASHEIGHRHYQHPGRTARHFGSYLDNFSAWNIYTALFCLARDPQLWAALSGGDECLLFRQPDLARPLTSFAFYLLESHADQQIALAARTLRYLTALPLETVPPLTTAVCPPSLLPAIVPDDLPIWKLSEDKQAPPPLQAAAGGNVSPSIPPGQGQVQAGPQVALKKRRHWTLRLVHNQTLDAGNLLPSAPELPADSGAASPSSSAACANTAFRSAPVLPMLHRQTQLFNPLMVTVSAMALVISIIGAYCFVYEQMRPKLEVAASVTEQIPSTPTQFPNVEAFSQEYCDFRDQLIYRVRGNWHPRNYQPAPTVMVTIDRGGDPIACIVNTSHDPRTDEAALQAVLTAGSPQLPKSLVGDQLTVEIPFADFAPTARAPLYAFEVESEAASSDTPTVTGKRTP